MNPSGGRFVRGLVVAALVSCAYSASAHASRARTWGGASTDYAASVALDARGNIYVAGSTSSFGAGGYDVLILKYNALGTLLWAKTWGGSGNDYASRIVVGPDGNIYVTGGTESFGAGWADLFVLKLDPAGNLKNGLAWGGSSYDFGYDIGFDQTGDIYVVGESYSNANSAVVLKFSSATGDLLWSASWKDQAATYSSGYSLVVDSDYNVVIAGIDWNYSVYPNHNSVLLVKYDSSGNYLWSEDWTTPMPGQDESGNYHALAADADGNIYVGARHSSDCQNSSFGLCDWDAMVLKLGPGGNLHWADTWTESGYTSLGGIALDPVTGELRVSGIEDAFGTPALFISSYDPQGDLLSTNGWSGQETISGSTIPGLALDSLGNAWVAGGASNNQGSWATFSGAPGTLANSLVSNSYTLGVPNGRISRLTAQTQSQTGVINTGGGGQDAFLVEFQR